MRKTIIILALLILTVAIIVPFASAGCRIVNGKQECDPVQPKLEDVVIGFSAVKESGKVVSFIDEQSGQPYVPTSLEYKAYQARNPGDQYDDHVETKGAGGADEPKGTKPIGTKINEFMSQQYPGLASLGGLALGDALSEWKKTVDKAFCDTVILGGQQCQIAAICGKSPERAGGDGVLVNEKYGNNTLTFNFVAHVEGERSDVALNGSSAQYLYRVTYAIRNPQRHEPNGYLIRFFYDGGSFDWFGQDVYQPFTKGQYIQAIGNQALVGYSERLYTRVCLVFQKTVEVSGQTTRQVCNTLANYGGRGTTPYTNGTITQTKPSLPAAPLQGGSGF